MIGKSSFLLLPVLLLFACQTEGVSSQEPDSSAGGAGGGARIGSAGAGGIAADDGSAGGGTVLPNVDASPDAATLPITDASTDGVSGMADAISGAGDSTASPTALSVVPKDNEPGSTDWTVDNLANPSGSKVAATATTKAGVETLIDGAAVEFFINGFTPVQFSWQNYVNKVLPAKDVPDGATLSLYVLQMPDAAQASGLYASLASASPYAGKSWADPSSPVIGSRSRITDTGDHWWINFYKGDFYVEVNVFSSQGPAPNYTQGLQSTKAAAISFAQAIAAKI
jgi:hypothetical protein